MIVAPIPIKGRRALIPWTLKRLTNMGVTPLCITEADKDTRLIESYNIPVKKFPKMSLGDKWNMGFEWARDYEPHAVLFVGSGDWVSDNWLDLYGEDYDMVGVRGAYFLHRMYKTKPHPTSLGDFTMKMGYWRGSIDERKGESAGGGRILSRRILERMDYRPFQKGADKNMDSSMLAQVNKHKGNVLLVTNDKYKTLSVSCDLWSNLHDIDQDSDIRIAGVKRFLKENFKEGLETWNVEGVYSQLK